MAKEISERLDGIFSEFEKDMRARKRFKITIEDDWISIVDLQDEGMGIFWKKQEWIDDPSIVPHIVDAVRVLCASPQAFAIEFDKLEVKKNV